MIEALGENVVLEPVKEESTEKKSTSGIILVSDFDIDMPRGKVLSKGADVPEWLNVGDMVIYPEQFGAIVKSDDEEYVIASYKVLHAKETDNG